MPEEARYEGTYAILIKAGSWLVIPPKGQESGREGEGEKGEKLKELMWVMKRFDKR